MYICAKQTESNDLLTAQWLCDCWLQWVLVFTFPPPVSSPSLFTSRHNPPYNRRSSTKCEDVRCEVIDIIVRPDQYEPSLLPSAPSAPCPPPISIMRQQSDCERLLLLLGQTRPERTQTSLWRPLYNSTLSSSTVISNIITVILVFIRENF